MIAGRRFERIIEHPVVLSYTAYDVLHHGEFGEGAPKPAGLEGHSPGWSTQERVRIVTEVLADLRGRGLAVVDTPVEPLLDAIRLLHDPHRRIYGWYAIGGDQQTVHGGFHIAESDDCAVLAVWEGDQFLLEPISSDALLATAASLLPDVEPVADPPLVVPSERPGGVERGEWAPVDDTPLDPAEEAAQREHERIEELTAGPLSFVMQVGRSFRTGRATERYCEYPLNYYAGAHGALLSVIKDVDEETGPRRHVVPATPDTFRDELRELARTP